MTFSRWTNERFDRVYVNGVSNDALDKIFIEPSKNPEVKGIEIKMTNKCYPISRLHKEIFEADIFKMLSYMKVNTYEELCEAIA